MIINKYVPKNRDAGTSIQRCTIFAGNHSCLISETEANVSSRWSMERVRNQWG